MLGFLYLEVFDKNGRIASPLLQNWRFILDLLWVSALSVGAI